MTHYTREEIHEVKGASKKKAGQVTNNPNVIAIIIFALVLGAVGGYYGHRQWGYGGGAGIGLATVLLVFLVAYRLGIFP